MSMIKLSPLSKEYLNSVVDKEELAKQMGVSLDTVKNVACENISPSKNFIAGFLRITMLDFEKAFEVSE